MPAEPEGRTVAGRIVRASNVERGGEIVELRQDVAIWSKKVRIKEEIQTRGVGVEGAHIEKVHAPDVGRLTQGYRGLVARDNLQVDREARAVGASCSDFAFARRDVGIGEWRDDTDNWSQVAFHTVVWRDLNH